MKIQKVELFDISDKQLKSSYLPKVSLNTSAKKTMKIKRIMNQQLLGLIWSMPYLI